MQRGFIQIPILIAVLIGAIVLGGTGYVAYEVGQKSSSKTLETTTVATTTEVEATTTPDSTEVDAGTNAGETTDEKVTTDIQTDVTTQEPIYTPSPILEPDPALVPESVPENFDLYCLTDDITVNTGEVDLEIFVEGNFRDYKVVWHENGLYIGQNSINPVFEFETAGKRTVPVTVTRKSDNHSQTTTCTVDVIEDIEDEDEDSYVDERSVELEDEITQGIAREYANLIYNNLYSWSVESRANFQLLLDEYGVYHSSFSPPAYNSPDKLVDFINYWEAWMSQRYNQSFEVPYWDYQ